MRAGLLQQLSGLVPASLSASQLGQADERRGSRRRSDPLQVALGRPDLRLRLLPLASPEQRGPVLDATESEEGAEAPAAAELLEARAPGGRPLDVPHPLAGLDHVAAGDADGVEVGHVAAQGGGGRGIELPHPVGDLARGHQRQAFRGTGEHLVVDIAQRSRDAPGLRGGGPGRHRCRP